MNKINTCSSCKWFQPSGGSKDFMDHPKDHMVIMAVVQSVCRRHAPVSCYGNEFGLPQMGFPHVREENFCGDYERSNRQKNEVIDD